MTTFLLVFCIRFVSFEGIFTFLNVMKRVLLVKNFYWCHFPTIKLLTKLKEEDVKLVQR